MGYFLHDSTPNIGGLDMTALPGFLYGYEADSPEMVAAYSDGDVVSTWFDIGGSRNLTRQNTPIYQAGDIREISFVKSRPDVFLGGTENVWLPNKNQQTIYAVVRPGSDTGTNIVMSYWWPGSASGQAWQLIYTTSLSRRRFTYQISRITSEGTSGVINVAGPTVLPVDFEDHIFVIAARWDGLNARLEYNALSPVTVAAEGVRFRPTGDSSQLRIGASGSTTGTNFGLQGKGSAFYIYEAAHDDETVAEVKAFLADKYGITLS